MQRKGEKEEEWNPVQEEERRFTGEERERSRAGVIDR